MRTIAAVLTASLLLAACSSSPTEEVTSSPSPTATTSPSPSPTPASAFPLTGVETDEPLDDQPVVAVKIENTPSAYPLAGIEQADVVYEQIVEGGVTRFAALFHSQLPERVGPVRSARFVDVPLLQPWAPVLVYSGARGEVNDALRGASLALEVDPGTRDGPIFFRAPDRPGSHDLLADPTAALDASGEDEEAAPVPEDPFAFDEDAPDDGVEQTDFDIAMTSASTSSWEWDDGDDVYRRLRNGEPFPVVDGEVGAATVVLVVAGIGQGGCCDTAGNPFTVTNLEGTGDAVVWRDGQRFEATWSKDSASDPLELLTAVGDPFPMATGPSWWHLAGSSAVPDAPTPEASETPSE